MTPPREYVKNLKITADSKNCKENIRQYNNALALQVWEFKKMESPKLLYDICPTGKGICL